MKKTNSTDKKIGVIDNFFLIKYVKIDVITKKKKYLL